MSTGLLKEKIQLDKVCRSCLSERGILRDIFSSKMPKMMVDCASIQVSEDDGLPRHICVTCFNLIAKFCSFKAKMERSDKILRAYIEETKQKTCNIIDIALNDAQINENSATISQSNEDLSDEDLPLSQRKIIEDHKKKMIKKEELGELGCGENPSKDCDSLPDTSIEPKAEEPEVKDSIATDVASTSSNTNNFSTQILDEPPPLIPLATAKTVDSKLPPKMLPKNTPPLVPLKQIVDVEKLITDVIEESPSVEIKLQCNNCDEEFSTVAALKEHKLNICQQNGLQCNICRKEFQDSKKLIGHLKGHMVSKDYACKICSKRYPNPSTFKVHMRTHTGERPFKCEICNKGFIRWAGVVGHMKTHESHKPYKCETCGKCFKIPSNLERHKVLHSGSLPFCCSYCGKTFSQSDNLRLHTRTYHTNERPYLCNECGKSFVSSTRLNRHMFVHTGFKPFECKICRKAYSNSNDLRIHEKCHIGAAGECQKPYACERCDMRFFHACRLKRHMKTHERPYHCTICGKKFSSELLLSRHSSKHGVRYVEEIIMGDGEVKQVFVEYHN